MGRNPYNPCLATVGRTTTDEAHQKMYKEKKESKAKKEKEKEERKKAREKKQETKLLPAEKKIRKQQGKKKDCKGSTNKARIGGKQNEEDLVREGSSQPPQKWPQRPSELKFRQNLKQLVCDGDTDDSSTDESDNNIWTDCEDFSDKFGVCKSINTL